VQVVGPRDRVLYRARPCRCRAQPAPNRAVRPTSRHTAARSPRAAGCRGDLPIALGIDFRALPRRGAWRKGDPAARRRVIYPSETTLNGGDGRLIVRSATDTPGLDAVFL